MAFLKKKTNRYHCIVTLDFLFSFSKTCFQKEEKKKKKNSKQIESIRSKYVKCLVFVIRVIEKLWTLVDSPKSLYYTRQLLVHRVAYITKKYAPFICLQYFRSFLTFIIIQSIVQNLLRIVNNLQSNKSLCGPKIFCNNFVESLEIKGK